ncbi:EAL domain-containing protein [Bradyrhizobium sp. STM 3562]|uniref:EAL domain-containing response regulator n=1 Tax=Bradyrhizobium sp. STM 3562 TaxID=578924 RepID=UPI00388E2400
MIGDTGPEAKVTKRSTFGRRKVVPRATIVDSKKHNQAFLLETLGELGFIASPCPAEPASIMETAPDLVVLGISGGDGVEISQILRVLADAEFAGSVLAIGPAHSVLVQAVRQLCNELGLAMLPMLPTPFSVEVLRGRVAGFLAPGAAPSPVVDVAEALKLGWLELWYQHKIDVHSLQPSGAEALVRIRHPAWGVVSPADFIPDSRDLSFRRFSEFVVSRAVEDWHMFVQERGPVEISINLPLAFLKDRPGVLDLCRKLPSHPAFGGLLVEINCDDIIRNGDLVVDIAQQLRFRNLAISVDDVGAEWPELRRLAIFPFVELKVDRQFVTGCAEDRLKQVVCRGIIDLARNYGARVVAKGIETRADFRAAHELGFDQAQGFLFGKPVSSQKFARAPRVAPG